MGFRGQKFRLLLIFAFFHHFSLAPPFLNYVWPFPHHFSPIYSNLGVIPPSPCQPVVFRNRLFLSEKYFDMNKKQCREALDLYKSFLLRMDRVAEFLKVAEVWVQIQMSINHGSKLIHMWQKVSIRVKFLIYMFKGLEVPDYQVSLYVLVSVVPKTY